MRECGKRWAAHEGKKKDVDSCSMFIIARDWVPTMATQTPPFNYYFLKKTNKIYTKYDVYCHLLFGVMQCYVFLVPM